jgi:hypothetical protein
MSPIISRAYAAPPDKLNTLSDEELRTILLTIDGRGREVKREALDILLARRDERCSEWRRVHFSSDDGTFDP